MFCKLHFLVQLTRDAAGTEDEKNVSLIFRARKSYETWQNDQDKSYRMPEAYKKLQDFCSQHQRAKAKAGTGVSGSGNSGTGTVNATSTPGSQNPPPKKVR